MGDVSTRKRARALGSPISPESERWPGRTWTAEGRIMRPGKPGKAGVVFRVDVADRWIVWRHRTGRAIHSSTPLSTAAYGRDG
ncbi:Os04g0605701 [Oryza sativa Japonica Group]|uniref:Os04g0605701 protein n=1 Tax=Oryza sativa subsp. japonica TaxID=39947 RepID=A0A0P0WEK9_ORYSJ|nr:Os04g0605701 [Oryza sativa Japonica Group]